MRKSVLLVIGAIAGVTWTGAAVQVTPMPEFFFQVAIAQAAPLFTSLRSPFAAVEPPSATKPTLQLEDLPAGFQPLSGAELADLSQSLAEGDYHTESLFAFQETEHFEYIIGFTTALPTPEAQAAFDAELRQTDFLEEFAKGFKQGAAGIGISQKGALPHLEGIGNAIAGLGMTSNIQSIPMRIDLVIFRREQVGAFLWIMYLDGDKPVIPVDQVAQKLDERILAAAKAAQAPQVVLTF